MDYVDKEDMKRENTVFAKLNHQKVLSWCSGYQYYTSLFLPCFYIFFTVKKFGINFCVNYVLKDCFDNRCDTVFYVILILALTELFYLSGIKFQPFLLVISSKMSLLHFAYDEIYEKVLIGQ